MELQQMLLDRQLDIALAYKSPISDERIDSRLLFENRLCLIGRTEKLKGCPNPVSVEALSNYALALPFKGSRRGTGLKQSCSGKV